MSEQQRGQVPYAQLGRQVQELEQTVATLQQLQAEREEFIAYVVHELRTPITFLAGYAELLLANEFGPLNDSQREALQALFDKAEALIHLISRLLAWQDIRARALDATPVQIEEIVSLAVRSAKAVAQQHNIKLSMQVDNPPLPPVLADPDRVGQILDNLLSNALKYSPGGGEIIVHLAREEDAIRCSVSDQGIGIPPKALKHIFDRFYRVGGTPAHGVPGLGLGLTIVREIVNAHGGHIGAESTLGKGSTFYFTLPLASQPSAQFSTTHPAQSAAEESL